MKTNALRKKVLLNEVCSFRHGGTPSKENQSFWNGKIPWASPKDMHTELLADTADHISEEAVEKSATSVVPPHTLLVTIRSGILARRLPIAITGREMAFNQDIKAIRPNTEVIDPHFLFFVLTSFESDILTNGVKYGATVHSMKSGYLEKLRFDLPAMTEQRRVAAWLREQMAEVERARVAVQAQLETAQALPAALLRDVFESPAAQRWLRRKLGDVIQVQSGYAFKSDWFTEAGIRLLRNVNVSQGCTNWDDAVYLPENRRDEFPDYELSEGDIILSLDRPVVSGGLKLTRLTKNDLPALLLQRVGRFVLKDGIDAGFLHHFLRTNDFIGKITAHDQSLGVPHVSPKQIEQIEIPLPVSLAEQTAIAARLDDELSAARALVETLESRLAEIELLPAALLRSAFGENTEN